MQTLYTSTRGKEGGIPASLTVLNGLASDGGLYVPEEFPKLKRKLEEYINLTYEEIASEILGSFLSDYTEEEIGACVKKAYGSGFDTRDKVALRKVGKVHFLELFHGPSLAFKDMALQVLPPLMQVAIKKNNLAHDILILTATSGDTGKAALSGFAGLNGIKIMVYYPKSGVSKIQELHMITQEGENVEVVGLEGNFDTAQNIVKEIFSNKEFSEELSKKNVKLSSANSINVGRLVPQIVYYVYAYSRLLASKEILVGDKVDFVVPTGNFGNILAAYYAKQMGLPINKLISASNDNNVLYDFFKTGIYDKRRCFKTTSSPSMDILISSNLERLLFEVSGRNCETVLRLMSDLNEKGVYEISPEMKSNLETFAGEYSNEFEAAEAIKQVFKDYSYLMDTHTAVAYSAYKKYTKKPNKKDKDSKATVIVSTANPYKFSDAVLEALGYESGDSVFENIDRLESLTSLRPPDEIRKLRDRKILHRLTCKPSECYDIIRKFI